MLPLTVSVSSVPLNTVTRLAVVVLVTVWHLYLSYLLFDIYGKAYQPTKTIQLSILVYLQPPPKYPTKKFSDV